MISIDLTHPDICTITFDGYEEHSKATTIFDLLCQKGVCAGCNLSVINGEYKETLYYVEN